jgi:hypothetical protein
MTVDSVFLKDINKNLFDLRNKKLTNLVKDDVDSAVVYQGDSTIVMVKDTSNAWHFSTGELLKEWKMNSFINNVVNLTAKKFVKENVTSSKMYGLDKPQRKVQFYKSGNLLTEVLFGESRGENHIAFSPQSKIIAEVQNYTFNNSEVKPKDFIEEKKEEDN